MSHIKEFIGRRSIEAANYDGKGNNLYNMWLTETEIIRCKDCDFFVVLDNRETVCGLRGNGMFHVEPIDFCSRACCGE